MPYNLFYQEVYSTVMGTNAKVSVLLLAIAYSSCMHNADGSLGSLKDHLKDVGSHGVRREEGKEFYSAIQRVPLRCLLGAKILILGWLRTDSTTE